MGQYKTIEYKAKLTKDNGETYIDLLSGNPNVTQRLTGYPIIVNQYYVARPDLISLAVYGEDIYADIICKVNGISNPFEIQEDNVLFIPSPEFVRDYIREATNASDLVDDESKAEITTLDIKYQKRKDETRSPNQQVVGDRLYVIDKSLGMVFY